MGRYVGKKTYLSGNMILINFLKRMKTMKNKMKIYSLLCFPLYFSVFQDEYWGDCNVKSIGPCS